MNTNEINQMINVYKKRIDVCENEIEQITHPEIYGCCLNKCNSIVINKERMMTITTNEKNEITHEFTPLCPTYFTPKTAKELVKNETFKDIHGNKIKMEIIGRLEYYQLLKDNCNKHIEILKTLL